MTSATPPKSAPLRLLYLEDNPLIVFHVEQLIEDLGHEFAGAVASFEDLVNSYTALAFDAALVDINLADGPTGPDAAAWLHEHGIPSIFVTGQEQMAQEHRTVTHATVGKPVDVVALDAALEKLQAAIAPA